MRRRTFLASLSSWAPSVVALAGRIAWSRDNGQEIRLVDFDEAGKRKGVITVEKVHKSDEEWRKQLTPEQFEVTRHAGTERAFTGKYWNNHEHGILWLHLLQHGAILVGHEVRIRNRLA